jgi:type I restriction enzyme S subunit
MDKKFLYQLLKFKEKLIMSLRVGSGLPNIQKNRIESLSLVIPNQEDQIAIAQVLSDMDAEVESLERKLEKCKILKQGMMQELLTGKVRLNHR